MTMIYAGVNSGVKTMKHYSNHKVLT